MLLAGLYAEDCTHVIRWLAAAQPEVAAQCVLESGAEIPDRDALMQKLRDAWLGHRLGLDIRLPTEWEWKRAARRTDGRAYPWGNDYQAGHANVDEARGEAGPHRLGRTSAVGIYPQGASPEGAMDLCGNVWEWCLNEYETTKRTQPGGNVSRVVRGGSWFNSQSPARAANRSRGHPHGRDDDRGCRLVCASPIR